MDKKRRSLQKFVFDKKKSSECFLCSIAEKDEIALARKSNVKLSYIAEWLIKECGYDAKSIKLKMKQMSTHLNNHVIKEGRDDWEAKL